MKRDLKEIGIWKIREICYEYFKDRGALNLRSLEEYRDIENTILYSMDDYREFVLILVDDVEWSGIDFYIDELSENLARRRLQVHAANSVLDKLEEAFRLFSDWMIERKDSLNAGEAG